MNYCEGGVNMNEFYINKEASSNVTECTRFVLEEQINDCWTIVEQLQLVKDATGDSKDQLIDAIKVLYQHKFIKLWDTFENMVESGNIK